MTLEELERVIVQKFAHLVILRTRAPPGEKVWLHEHFGSDAASILFDSQHWKFDDGARWTVGVRSDDWRPFRFRLLEDAILFKLTCG